MIELCRAIQAENLCYALTLQFGDDQDRLMVNQYF